MSDSDLRTEVWSYMVETDRLKRYYGELAGKLSGRERWMTGTTTVLAMVAVGVASFGQVAWTVVATLMTVAASLVPLVYRVSGVVTAATQRQARLGDLFVEWRELWGQVDDLSPEDIRTKWKKLASRQNEITEVMVDKKMDRKLRDSTEKEAYDYWRNKARQAARAAT